MLSIRKRVLLLVLGLLALTLPLIALTSYLDAQHEVEEVFDAEMAQGARLVASLVRLGARGSDAGALQAALDEVGQRPPGGVAGHVYEGKLAFVVTDTQGQVLLHSASAPAALMADRIVHAPTQGWHEAALGDRTWRLFALHDAPAGHWVVMGQRDDVREELATFIALRTLLPELVGFPLIGLGVWLAVGWGLRPLRTLVDLLKARDPEKLAPMVLAPIPAELEPIVASLNRLLSQVGDLVEREKRLLSYAAHELRTPLAVLRIQAHNAQHASDPVDRAEAQQALGPSIARATRVVEQLLTFARLEPGAQTLHVRRLDLGPFLREQLAELAPLALERGQDLDLDIAAGAPLQVEADPACLVALVQNLVGNAIQHTPKGGQVRVVLQPHAGEVQLRVQDSGCGVPPALRERVFEPFFRDGPGQGAGLGLAIVRRVAALIRATLVLGDSPLGGLEVCVRMARAGDA